MKTRPERHPSRPGRLRQSTRSRRMQKAIALLRPALLRPTKARRRRSRRPSARHHPSRRSLNTLPHDPRKQRQNPRRNRRPEQRPKQRPPHMKVQLARKQSPSRRPPSRQSPSTQLRDLRSLSRLLRRTKVRQGLNQSPPKRPNRQNLNTPPRGRRRPSRLLSLMKVRRKQNPRRQSPQGLNMRKRSVQRVGLLQPMPPARLNPNIRALRNQRASQPPQKKRKNLRGRCQIVR